MSEIIKGCLGFKGEKGEHGEVGTPIPFEGTFQELQNSEENRDRFYIIMDEQDEVYYKHWVYYDEKTEQWKDGGEYLANLIINLEDLTQEEWESLKSNLTNYYKRYESVYTTTQENEINIPINISQYNTLAILEVYIEGRMLNRNEYAINGTNSITLVTPLSIIGTKVHFVVYRSVCATNQDIVNLKGDKGDSGAIVFNNVADMKADTGLVVGDTCQTLGYYLANDGGAGLYKIVDDDTLVDDGGSIHQLENGLKAELIVENTITPEMFGAKGDSSSDDSNSIVAAFNLAKVKNIKLVFNKTYYINTNILLDGESNTVNIEQKSGYLKIDKTITIRDLNHSNISLIINGGGSNNINNYSVIFEKIFTSDLNLNANNVLQTAFCMNDYDGSLGRNTAILKGNNNMRTLYHAPLSGRGGSFFGVYLDIEDRFSQNPIRFEECSDITINHIENYFEDNSYSKNTVEFSYCGSIHIGVLALGGTCKNFLYINSTDISIIDCFVNNEDRTTDPSLVTGIYAENDCEIRIFALRNIRCKYALDCSNVLYGKRVLVDRVFLQENVSDTMQKGILFSGYASNNNYLLAYNDIHNIKTGITATSSYANVQNVRVYKKDGMIYCNGYIIINQDITAGDTIFKFVSENDALSLNRCDFPVFQGYAVKHLKIAKGSSEIKSDSDIRLSDGNVLAFNFSYPAQHFENY